jgi:hypothetical protein
MRLNIPYNNKTVVNHIDGFNSDIITVIHSNVPAAKSQMRDISRAYFNTGNEMTTCRKIWDFLKREIKYKKDPDGYQNIKLPGRFVAEATGDCKSYSLFTASILENLNIPYSFRYTSYSANPTPQHVYIITDSGIIIDAVWNKFNSEKKYTYKKDYPMKIQTLSGIGCNNCQSNNIGSVNSSVLIGDIGFLKKAAQKVQTAVKNTAVVKKAAQLQTAAKNTALVKKAAQLQSQVKAGGVKSVALAAPRRAFRTLVAINFRGWATSLNSNRDKAIQIWQKAGGTNSELIKSIDAGKNRKALFAKDNDKISGIDSIGELTLATVGSTLAIAAPIVAMFTGLLKTIREDLNLGKKRGEQSNDNTGIAPPTFSSNETVKESSGGSTSSSENYQAPQNEGEQSTDFTKPLLYVGLSLLAAKMFKLI